MNFKMVSKCIFQHVAKAIGLVIVTKISVQR